MERIMNSYKNTNPYDVMNQIGRQLQKELDEKRFAHVLGVAYTAASMAACYHYDIEKAFLAGLLHDCAKGMSHQERMLFCRKRHIAVSDAEVENPSLLHAKVGSYLTKEVYGIEDEEIAKAVLYHTTGHPNMSLLEKIIFTADYIEPMREHDPQLPQIREEAFHNLDECIAHILKNTLVYLQSKKSTVDPMTEETYQFYK